MKVMKAYKINDSVPEVILVHHEREEPLEES